MEGGEEREERGKGRTVHESNVGRNLLIKEWKVKIKVKFVSMNNTCFMASLGYKVLLGFLFFPFFCALKSRSIL